MAKHEKRNFKKFIGGWWHLLRSVVAPEYQPMLRKLLRQFIAAEEKEYKEFVALMSTSKEDLANKKPQDAAYDMAAYDMADELQNIEDGRVTHQCHYCGDMYHISDLSGAKEGLICYKCRHEMENRE
jgi:hypothetical protein